MFWRWPPAHTHGRTPRTRSAYCQTQLYHRQFSTEQPAVTMRTEEPNRAATAAHSCARTCWEIRVATTTTISGGCQKARSSECCVARDDCTQTGDLLCLTLFLLKVNGYSKVCGLRIHCLKIAELLHHFHTLSSSWVFCFFLTPQRVAEAPSSPPLLLLLCAHIFPSSHKVVVLLSGYFFGKRIMCMSARACGQCLFCLFIWWHAASCLGPLV